MAQCLIKNALVHSCHSLYIAEVYRDYLNIDGDLCIIDNFGLAGTEPIDVFPIWRHLTTYAALRT